MPNFFLLKLVNEKTFFCFNLKKVKVGVKPWLWNELEKVIQCLFNSHFHRDRNSSNIEQAARYKTVMVMFEL